MKKVLDFLIKIIYINIVNRIAFFCLILIFIEAVYSENCSNAVLLTQKILPFYFKESQVERLCKCGCGQLIVIKYHHKYYGIPDYIHGHSSRCFSDETKRKIGISTKNREWTKERNKKISIANTGKHHSAKTKEKLSKINMGKHLSDETKEKISKANKGANNSFYGKQHSEEAKQKMRINSKRRSGWHHSEKTKIKISMNNGKGMFGKHHSEATKEKISKINKGNKNGMYGKTPWNKTKRYSEETKKKMSGSRIKYMLENKDIFKDTSIEIAMEKQLKLNNFKYEKQKHIKNVGIVDFFLPDYNTILECDGDYFHNLPGAQQKDINRDFKAILYHNYRTIRFWEHEINEDIEGCIYKILGVLGERVIV